MHERVDVALQIIYEWYNYSFCVWTETMKPNDYIVHVKVWAEYKNE